MTRKITTSEGSTIFLGGDIPMRVIRRYARQIGDQFRPDKVILFGSYASGVPHDDSDVDLLVIMDCRNELDMAVQISWKLPAPFPMDLLVRKPAEWDWSVHEKESFATEILTKGKVLYERCHARVGAKGRGRPPRGKRSVPRL